MNIQNARAHVISGQQKLGASATLPKSWTNPRDCSVLQLVPSGQFTMGSSPRQIEAALRTEAADDGFNFRHETPQCRVSVSAFYISRFAVTNFQYARFLTDAQPTLEQLRVWGALLAHILMPIRRGESFRVKEGFEDHPATHISWFGAEAYCLWAGLRLPSEMEWEKAARGTDGRIFPWGNEWRDEFLRWRGGFHTDGETTAPVDAFPEGRSPYGLFQMAGNVEEWCADAYQSNIYRQYAAGAVLIPRSGMTRVLRGGSCLRERKFEFRCAARRASLPALENNVFTGIRCSCDAKLVAENTPPSQL